SLCRLRGWSVREARRPLFRRCLICIYSRLHLLLNSLYCAKFTGFLTLAALNADSGIDLMLLFLLAADRAHRTVSCTGCTALAVLCDLIVDESLTGFCSTFVVVNVILIFIAEITESGEYRVGSCLAQTAHSAVFDLGC